MIYYFTTPNTDPQSLLVFTVLPRCYVIDAGRTFQGRLSKDDFPKTTFQRRLSKDDFPKTTFQRRLSKDDFPRTTFRRRLSKDDFPKTTFQRRLCKDDFPKTTVQRRLSKDDFPRTTFQRRLSKDDFPKTTFQRRRLSARGNIVELSVDELSLQTLEFRVPTQVPSALRNYGWYQGGRRGGGG